MPSQPARPWDSVRRIREPVAWTLLVIPAISMLVSAWQLFGLPGAPVAVGLPVPVVPGSPPPAAVSNFDVRASVVAPQFVAGGIFLLPLLAVILVTFAGGLTARARQVVQTAVWIQVVTLGLGVISWLAAFGGHLRHGVWFIFGAANLAAVAVALIVTVAVFRSQALQPLPPDLIDFDEDEGFEEDDEDLEEDT